MPPRGFINADAPSYLPLKGEAFPPNGKSYPLGEDLRGALSPFPPCRSYKSLPKWASSSV